MISGVEMEEQTQNIQGLHGSFDMGATYKGREISVPFSFQGQNMASYPLFRDLIYKITTSTESYYIQEMRRPQVAGYTFKDTKDSNAISQLTNTAEIQRTMKRNPAMKFQHRQTLSC